MPCGALGAAIGNAARRGVLVKHGPAMEQIGKLDVIALDKTGTVTLGEPRVQQTLALNGMSPSTVLAYAACAERSSEHPLARAIVEQRTEAPFETTGDLVSLIRRLGIGRGRKHNPATLVFQALRIAVNDEFGGLAQGLEAAERALASDAPEGAEVRVVAQKETRLVVETTADRPPQLIGVRHNRTTTRPRASSWRCRSTSSVDFPVP